MAEDLRSASPELSLDDAFELLANRRRRHAISCLAEHAQPIALADLAEEVANREHEGSFTEIPKEEIKSVYTTLYHTHVPKLAEAGVVEYEQDRDLVQTSEEGERLEHVRSLFAAAVAEQ